MKVLTRCRIRLLLFLMTAWGCAGSDPSLQVECQMTADCQLGEQCLNGRCIETDVCEDGRPGPCDSTDECRRDEQCADGRCVDGQCFSNQCEDGDQRGCGTNCGGLQTCRGGVWRPCQGALSTDADLGMDCGRPDAGNVTPLDTGPLDDAGMQRPHDGSLDQGTVEQDAEPPPMDMAWPAPVNDQCIDGVQLMTDQISRLNGDTRGGSAIIRDAPDVWYRFTLEEPMNVDALVERQGDWDPYLYLLRGPCEDSEILDSNDDSDGVENARIDAELEPGDYYLVVSGFDMDDRGLFDITVSFTSLVGANDRCPGAIEMPLENPAIVAGDTRGAAVDYDRSRGPDLWYRFDLEVAADVDVTLQGEPSWDTFLYLLRGHCGQLEEVALNDDFDGQVWSRIQAAGLPAGQYYVVVAGYEDGESGPFTLQLDQVVSQRFQDTVFMSTHNSYSGGDRRSIIAQLDAGVRLLEFDIHDNDYRNAGGFRIGHDSPSDEVVLGGGNPLTSLLGAWLAVVHGWSADHEGHAPITVVIDLKDDLTDNRSFEEGNLGALNHLLHASLGARLFPASSVGNRGADWPALRALDDRILILLSGHEETRRAYMRDQGYRPAIAQSIDGWVVEVHDSGSGHLWYWTGRLNPDNESIRWNGHGRYDTGTDPDVAINGSGLIVEVHQSENARTLWYRVGQLREDGQSIDFGESHRYDDGQSPRIRFTGEFTVEEIHRDGGGNDRVYRLGRVNEERREIMWIESGRTDAALPAKTESTVEYQGREFRTTVRQRPADQTLRYSMNGGDESPIRYESLAFVEGREGDGPWLDSSIHFFAAEESANRNAFVDQWLNRGGMIRRWGFNQLREGIRANFPATDVPHAAWYIELMRNLGAPDIP